MIRVISSWKEMSAVWYHAYEAYIHINSYIGWYGSLKKESKNYVHIIIMSKLDELM